MATRGFRLIAGCLLSLGMACAERQLEPTQLQQDADAAVQEAASLDAQAQLEPTQLQRSADAAVQGAASLDAQAEDDAHATAPMHVQPGVTQPMTLKWRGVSLAATLYLPDGNGPFPAVVTAPGFGGVKEMLIPAFAASAAEAGIATLAIDYAGFGGSEGSPRQHVDPTAQVDQLRTALDSLAINPAIDPTRLGVWGTSLSGGHALALASTDPRIRCVVAIIPFVSASETEISAELLALVAADVLARAIGLAGGTVPAVGHPGDVAVMTTDGAWEWSEAITKDAPSWKNEVTLASLPEMDAYSPTDKAAAIEVPVRTILATSDTITPPALALKALADVPHLDVVERPDTHFELFRNRLDDTISLTTGWLAMHLTSAPTSGAPKP